MKSPHHTFLPSPNLLPFPILHNLGIVLFLFANRLPIHSPAWQEARSEAAGQVPWPSRTMRKLPTL